MTTPALKTQLDEYIKFSKQFPSLYRSAIVSHLLSTARFPQDARPIPQMERESATAQPETPASGATEPKREVDVQRIYAQLSSATGVEVAELKHAIDISASGGIEVKALLRD